MIVSERKKKKRNKRSQDGDTLSIVHFDVPILRDEDVKGEPLRV